MMTEPHSNPPSSEESEEAKDVIPPRNPMEAIGVLLIVFGLGLIIIGAAVLALGRLGELPGNLRFQIGSATFFSPCLTMIVLSIVGSILLTIVVNVIVRLLNR
jgi:hypothetical protein